MKQLLYGFVIVAILCSLPTLSLGAGRIVNVPQTGYLNEFIASDAALRGDTTTYILARNGIYNVNAFINNVGWTLRMRSAFGTGYPATIFMKLGATGTTVPDLIQIAGNLSLSNLEISGYDETVTPSALGTISQEVFNVTAAGVNITIDSCILTNCGQGMIRCNSAPSVVKITNTTFANMGSRLFSDLGNGRAVDVRSGSCDSLIMVNNTFVNNGDRIVRHYSSTAPIKYMKFDHNTIVNDMAFHGMLSFGYTQGQFIITNNLLINPFALGSDTDATRQVEFADNGENDPLNGRPRMTWINSKPDTAGQAVPTVWTIKNNYYRVTPADSIFYANAGANPPLSVGNPLPYHISKKIGTDSLTAFRKVYTDLNKIPAVMTDMMNYYRSPSGANKTKVNNTGSPDFNRVSYIYLTDSLDCRYPTSAAIYTAATGGQPVGSLMWFGLKVGVAKSNESPIPSSYALYQNYPNPFNPSTNFTYEISKTGFVSVKIFDLLGREVATLVNEVKQAGSYPATWNAAGFGSGIYFCKMQSGSFIATKKMILMK